jgi:hypothetical protein
MISYLFYLALCTAFTVFMAYESLDDSLGDIYSSSGGRGGIRALIGVIALVFTAFYVWEEGRQMLKEKRQYFDSWNLLGKCCVCVCFCLFVCVCMCMYVFVSVFNESFLTDVPLFCSVHHPPTHPRHSDVLFGRNAHSAASVTARCAVFHCVGGHYLRVAQDDGVLACVQQHGAVNTSAITPMSARMPPRPPLLL